MNATHRELPAAIAPDSMLSHVARDGDDQLLSYLLRSFLLETETRADALRTALEFESLPSIAAIAHALGGMAGAMGLDQLHTMLTLLEDEAARGEAGAVRHLAQPTLDALDAARAAVEAWLRSLAR